MSELENAYPWVAAIAGGGGVVGWYRERRKSRKDANTFALDLIGTQNERIDALTFQVGELTGRISQLSEVNALLVAENLKLKADISALIAEAKLKADAVIAAAVVQAKGNERPRRTRRTDIADA